MPGLLDDFCTKAGIPFGYRDSSGRWHNTWALTSRQREWILFILSSLKLKTDYELIARNYQIYPGYADVFFKRDNKLFLLDDLAQSQIIDKSSLNIILTGLGSLTGCGKSWSAFSFIFRWNPVDKKGRVLFNTDKNILMDESETEKIEGFKDNFYSIDDPELNDVGVGIQAIKEQLSKFMRQASRKARSSLLICSAIDILKTNKLSLDGIHFYLEMIGINKDYQCAVGMLYDRFYNPLGWVLIPSPLQQQIKFFDITKQKVVERSLVFYDPVAKKEQTAQDIMDYYEQVMKTDYVTRVINQEDNTKIKRNIDRVMAMPAFHEFVQHEHNQKKTQIEAWLITNSRIKTTLKVYAIMATRIFSLITTDQLTIQETRSDIVLNPTLKTDLVRTDLIPEDFFLFMFSDEAFEYVKSLSPKYFALAERAREQMTKRIVDKIAYRDIAEEHSISSSTCHKLIKQGIEALAGHLAEWAYSKYHPELTWQGGNTPGLADFISEQDQKVISLKFRSSKDYYFSEKDLSRQEIELINQGWSGELIVIDSNSRKMKHYSIFSSTPTQPKASKQPLSSSPQSTVVRQTSAGSSTAPTKGSAAAAAKTTATPAKPKAAATTKPSKAKVEAAKPPKAPRKGGVVKQLIGGEK